MAPAKKKKPQGPTVFFGRETAVRREEVERLLPTVEGSSDNYDDFLIGSSDKIDSSSSEEDEGFTTPPEETTSTKRPRSPTVSDKEPSPSPNAKNPPPKRQRRTKNEPVAKSRRSSRIPTTADKPEAKSARAKVVAAKKTGRDRPPKKPSPDEDSDPAEPQDKEWEVEKIVDSRIDAVTQEHFYRVKWKGYAAKDNTWEPKKNLAHCLQAVRDYEKKSKKKS